jgi:serine O-acetyltransferase
MEVPYGLDGARRDFVHYCKVHDARGFAARLLLPLREPALLALWTYRYGRWIHFQGKPRFRALHHLFYTALFELVRHVTGVLIQRWSEIGEEVWLESHHPSILGVKRIEKGSFVFGGVTIGVGGPKEARGVPSFGEGVVIGPGVICTGPVVVPRGSVLGPNAVVMKSLPKEGAGWIGAPAKEWPGPREALVPRIGGAS